MDAEIARLRSEVGQLHSTVGQVDAKVGRLGSAVGQLGSEVALVQTDMRKNDTSIVDLANGERASQQGDVSGSPLSPQQAANAVPSPSASPGKTPKYGMSQQEILGVFGNPHSMERVLDSVYWYYADGELKGQYVRFDVTTGHVNGWSTFSPQHFQIDLETRPGG
jgi:hypothetical protein